jgi:hypothetical protein
VTRAATLPVSVLERLEACILEAHYDVYSGIPTVTKSSKSGMYTAVCLEGVAFRDDYGDAQHQYRQRPQLLIREATPSLICDAHSDSKLKTISHRDYLRCLGFAARSAIRPNCHLACIRMLLLETLKAFVCSEEPSQCSRHYMTR